MRTRMMLVVAMVLGVVAMPVAQTPVCRIGAFQWVSPAPIAFQSSGAVVPSPLGPYAAYLTVFASPNTPTACEGITWTLQSSDAAFTVAHASQATFAASVTARGSVTLKAKASANTGAARSGAFLLTVSGPNAANAVVTNALVPVTQAGL